MYFKNIFTVFDFLTKYAIVAFKHIRGHDIRAAKDPRGPWSEPYWLGDDAAGIDPSLFFDDDGSCWYVGQREKAGCQYNGDCESTSPAWIWRPCGSQDR